MKRTINKILLGAGVSVVAALCIFMGNIMLGFISYKVDKPEKAIRQHLIDSLQTDNIKKIQVEFRNVRPALDSILKFQSRISSHLNSHDTYFLIMAKEIKGIEVLKDLIKQEQSHEQTMLFKRSISKHDTL